MSQAGQANSPSVSGHRRSGLLAGLYIVLGSVALFLAIGAATYSLEVRWPLAWSGRDFLKWILPGGVSAGALCGLGMIWRIRRQRRRGRPVRTLHSSLAVACAVVLGLGFGGMLVILANAVLDSSPAQYCDVEIVDARNLTRHGILRSCEVSYVELGSRKTGRLPVRAAQSRQFKMGGAGVLDVRQGFLGMPWVRQICPVDLHEVAGPDGYPEVIAVPRRAGKPDEAEFIYFSLVVLLENGRTMPASAALWELVREHDVSMGGMPAGGDDDFDMVLNADSAPASQPCE